MERLAKPYQSTVNTSLVKNVEYTVNLLNNLGVRYVLVEEDDQVRVELFTPDDCYLDYIIITTSGKNIERYKDVSFLIR